MSEEPEIVGEEVEQLEAEEEEFVAAGGVTEVKLFGKWSFDDIEVRDISLVVSAFAVDIAAYYLFKPNLIFSCDNRITSLAREIMLPTSHTQLVVIKRSDSARLLAPLLSDWYAALCVKDETVERSLWLSESFNTPLRLSTSSRTRTLCR